MFRITEERRDHSRLKVNLNWRRMNTVSSYHSRCDFIRASLFSCFSHYSIVAVHP